MALTTPFATPFQAAGGDSSGSCSPTSEPRRLVGFASSTPGGAGAAGGGLPGLQRAHTTGPCVMDRQGSLGALLRQEQRPKLAINVARGGRRVNRVPRINTIQEAGGTAPQAAPAPGTALAVAPLPSAFAAAPPPPSAFAAGPSSPSAFTTASPAKPAAAAVPMVRTRSTNVDIPSRIMLSKACTAPESGLTDDVIAAAISCGLAQQPKPPPADEHDGGRGGSGVLAPAAAAAAQTARSASGGRPPMPISPFTPLQLQQEQRQAGMARDLFQAHADTAQAQAQVSGLQEALRRGQEEMAHMQAELASMRRDNQALRSALAGAAAAQAQGQQRLASASSGGSSRLLPAASLAELAEPGAMVSVFAGADLAFSFDDD